MAPLENEKQTRPSLLLRVRSASDQAAWNEFVDIYGPVIFGYCRYRKLQESDAADVTQNALLRLSKVMAGFEYRPEIGRFRDWLGRVIYREILKFWNKEKKQDLLDSAADDSTDGGDPGSTWVEYFQSEILQISLDNIRSQFDTTTLEIFRLAWQEDWAAAAVAESLRIPIDRVYVAKSRVLKRLREEVHRLTEDLPIAEH